MVSRRDALKMLSRGSVGLAAGALALTKFGGCQPKANGPTKETTMNGEPATLKATASTRMPTVFLPHGGGPWPFMDLDAMGLAGAYTKMEAYMRGLGVVAPTRPRAVLMVSAHWEETAPTLMTAPNPPMLYDYSGFPPETYEVQWPAPGAPEVAERAQELLAAAKIETGLDARRGFDHGTFVPMKLAYPGADMPTFQLSLKRGLDPRAHLALGRALAPLRDEGVLIVGSGMSYHNMGGFFGRVPTASEDSKAFDDWLVETAMADADRRDTRLAEWASAPKARACHPREEHLLPLMVVAGAAGDGAGTTPYQDEVMGVRISAAHFA